MSDQGADIIGLLAGIEPGSTIDLLRDQRPQARENAQLSFEALLEPRQPGTFPLAERYAVAAFVAQLHGFAAATAFYLDLLGDEDDALIDPVRAAARSARAEGPAGAYREPALAGESTPGPAWDAPDGLDQRLGAALAHAHLLVFRPREAGPDDLRALAAAGWSADDTVSLSQLVSFLTFQLRAAWGLRVLSQNPVQEGAAA